LGIRWWQVKVGRRGTATGAFIVGTDSSGITYHMSLAGRERPAGQSGTVDEAQAAIETTLTIRYPAN
jgi:hypothetical protein